MGCTWNCRTCSDEVPAEYGALIHSRGINRVIGNDNMDKFTEFQAGAMRVRLLEKHHEADTGSGMWDNINSGP
jgi:hypothetical protein